MEKIAILTYQNAALFELACAVELFALPRPEFSDWYQAEVVSFDDGPHSTTAGLSITSNKVSNLDDFSTLIIPSWPTHITAVKGVLREQILSFHTDKKRILSFCSGAFLLGSLGLLNGREATTHWRYADKFKQRFPQINYQDNVLYVFDGQIGCSAGSASAIDLSLEVIRQDHGQSIANQVARRLVLSAHRKGGQAQFVESPTLALPDHFSDAMDWALNNLEQRFSIDRLAEKALMSRRTFDRKFRQAFNLTAKEWLTAQRLNQAKELLESTATTIELVAQHAGFDNATTLRHHFRKSLGLSPRQYRDQFSSGLKTG